MRAVRMVFVTNAGRQLSEATGGVGQSTQPAVYCEPPLPALPTEVETNS